MHRTEGPNHENNTFAAGPPATVVDPSFMNSVQEEIAGVIEGVGNALLTAETDTRDQLYAAILSLVTDTQLSKNDFWGFETWTQTDDYVGIAPGFCIDDTRTGYITISSIVNVNIGGSTGTSAMDVAGSPANTFHYTYVIKNPTTGSVDTLISLNESSPVMPNGYTMKRRVGVFRTNAASAIKHFRAVGKGMDKKYFYQSGVNFIVFQQSTGVTWHDISCNSFVPPTAGIAIMGFEGTDVDNIRVDAVFDQSVGQGFPIGYTTSFNMNTFEIPVYSQGFSMQGYLASADDGACILRVFGFIDNLNWSVVEPTT